MATTIKLKNSVTTTNAPSSLAQGEVAINITDKKVWVGNAATTPIQLLGDGASLNFTSLSLSGNLTFTGTGNRITGDFSTAPPNITNRVMIQSSTTNGQTGVIAIPNGTSTAVQFEANSDSAGGTNGSIAQLAMVGGSDVRLVSGSRGTGTNLPLTMLTGGSERLRIDTSGNLLVGTTTTRNKLTVSGTATTTPTLGTASGAALFAGTDLGYGTMIGTGSSGNGWIQQQRVDGTGTAYDLLLQPSGGNVGIGTSSPADKLNVVLNNSSLGGIRLQNTNGSGQSAVSYYNDGNTQKADIWWNNNGSILNFRTLSTDPMVFTTNNTERMRITSDGIVRINNTANATYNTQLNVYFPSTLNAGIHCRTNTSSAISQIIFGNATNDFVGDISTNGSATAYNTSSDYRLKENIAPMTGALNVVAQLKPCTYNWKVDGTAGQGFIAHELQAVVPDAVTGEKDAVDENGNPRYQGVDTSFLVATLTAAIQELKAELDSVKAELNQLKGA